MPFPTPARLATSLTCTRWKSRSAKTAAEERGYTSVILVTSDYHVPRAWIAFRRVLPPRVALHVLPVRSEGWGSAGAAWRTARRYFLEGWKYWGYRLLLRWE